MFRRGINRTGKTWVALDEVGGDDEVHLNRLHARSFGLGSKVNLRKLELDKGREDKWRPTRTCSVKISP